MEICLITGTSTGIGRATALHLARNGYKVHATMRNVAKGADMLAVAAAEKLPLVVSQLDVLDAASMARAVERIEAEDGHIDVLVNNAGLSSSSPFETYPEDEHRDVMEANYWGPVRLTQRLLPGMRRRRHGAIVNITSLLGRLAFANQAAYCASKFALEAMSECLALEVAPFGVRVAIIEPGITKSAIFAKNIDAPNQSGAYDAHYRRLFQFYAAGLAEATDPFEVADVIYEAFTTDSPQLRYVTSWGGREMVEGRERMNDDDWVAMGVTDDDAEYYRRFNDLFDLDISPR